MPQFFLCHNPIAKNPPAWLDYVYHAEKPKFFAGLMEIDPNKPFVPLDHGGRNQLFLYTRGDGHMRLFLLLVFQNLDRATSKLDTTLKQAAGWYISSLNVTDEKQFGKRGSYTFLEDFNVLTPGLCILELPWITKLIVSYEAGIKSFDDAIAMDQFLSKTLGYNNLQLETGNQNVYDPFEQTSKT